MGLNTHEHHTVYRCLLYARCVSGGGGPLRAQRGGMGGAARRRLNRENGKTIPSSRGSCCRQSSNSRSRKKCSFELFCSNGLRDLQQKMLRARLRILFDLRRCTGRLSVAPPVPYVPDLVCIQTVSTSIVLIAVYGPSDGLCSSSALHQL